MSDVNRFLLPVIGDDSNFAEAAPMLFFGMEFAKKGKEMVEQVKVPLSNRSGNTVLSRWPLHRLRGLQQWERQRPELSVQRAAISDSEKKGLLQGNQRTKQN